MRLGKELRRLREDAGVTRPAAAAAIGCSPGKIGHIELGKYAPSKSDLIVLLRDHYMADDETQTTLEDLRAEASKRGWWSTYGLPEWLASYVGLEYDATSLRVLSLELIPGLLQTEDYARKLIQLRGRLSDRELQRRVDARMQRQERLIGPGPLELTAVMSQAALERCAYQECLASEQFQVLIERAQLPNVDVRILPFSVGMHAGMTGPFSVLSFPEGLLPDAAYQEYVVGGHIIDDPAVVSQMDTLLGELQGQALGPNESLTMISELAEHTR